MLTSEPAGDCSAWRLRHASPEVFQDIRDTKPFLSIPVPLWSYLAAQVRSGQMTLADFGAYLMLYQAAEPEGFVLQGGYRRLMAIWSCSQKTAQRTLGRLESQVLVAREYARSGHHRTPLVAVRLTLAYEVGQLMLKKAPDRRCGQDVNKSPGSDKGGPPRQVRDVHQGNRSVTGSEKTPDTGDPPQSPRSKSCRSGKSPVSRLREVLKTNVGGTAAEELAKLEAMIRQSEESATPPPASDKRERPRLASVRMERGPQPVKAWYAALESRPVVKPARTDRALRLPPALRARLEAGLRDRNPAERERLMEEVAFSVTEGAGWRCGPEKALSVCLRLIREGRWERPYGMS